MVADYEFTNHWFNDHWNNWKVLTDNMVIRRILEIGAFEGRSACTMIDHFGSLNDLLVVSIDTWSGGPEHGGINMGAVERRFDANIACSIASAANKVDHIKLKGLSGYHLAKLIAEGYSHTFDLVFIDGSHQAADVLTDCVIGYQLCRLGGLMICDDYLWSMESEGQEHLHNMPKLGIDAFSLAFTRRVKQIPCHLYQAYFRKVQ